MTQQKRYREIADKLAERIKTGAYTGGQKLPAIRTLAKIHNVALLTAKHALDTLVKQGLAVPVGQSGYYAQTGETAGKNNTIVIAVYDFFKLTSVIEKLFRTFEKRSSFKIEVRYFLEKDFLENPEIVRNSNLIIANEWMMHEIYRNKLFQDINPRFSGFPVKRADFYSELLDLFSINRQQIALPLFFSPMLLFFNRSIFKNRRLGFPDSSWKWTDLEQAAEKLSQPGKNGKQHAGLQTNILNKNRLNAMILQKTGGIILPGRQAEEKKFFSSMFEALDFIRRLNQKFNLTLDMSMIENNFFDRQRIAMTYLTMVLSGTGSQTLQKIYPHLGITPLPAAANRFAHLTAAGLVFNNIEGLEEIIPSFLGTLFSRESMMCFNSHACGFPAVKIVNEKILSVSYDKNSIDIIEIIEQLPGIIIHKEYFDGCRTMKLHWLFYNYIYNLAGREELVSGIKKINKEIRHEK